jgi:hypothetical protein
MWCGVIFVNGLCRESCAEPWDCCTAAGENDLEESLGEGLDV